MKSARLLMSCLPLLAPVHSGEPSPAFFSAPLPALPAGHEVRIDEVTLPPGAAVPSHRHDAHIYVYVIEGVVEMQVQGGELCRLGPGQVFTESPADTHPVMRNASAAQSARMVSFAIKAAGAPPARFQDPGASGSAPAAW